MLQWQQLQLCALSCRVAGFPRPDGNRALLSVCKKGQVLQGPGVHLCSWLAGAPLYARGRHAAHPIPALPARSNQLKELQRLELMQKELGQIAQPLSPPGLPAPSLRHMGMSLNLVAEKLQISAPPEGSELGTSESQKRMLFWL